MAGPEITSSFARDDNEVLTTTNKNYAQGALVNPSSAPDVILADTTPGTTVLIDQQQITVELDHGANTTTTPTFQLGTTASKVITRLGASTLLVGDTSGTGNSLELKFSAALNKWVLLNPFNVNSVQIQIDADTDINGFKFLDVDDAVLNNQFGTLGQNNQSYPMAINATGTTDAIIVTFSPALPALIDTQPVRFKHTAGPNTTTTPTVDFGFGAKTIVARGGFALAIGDLGAMSQVVDGVYNAGNDKVELLNPAITATIDIADDAIILQKMANNSVDTDELVALSVTGDKIADNTITEDKIIEPTGASTTIIKRLWGDSPNTNVVVTSFPDIDASYSSLDNDQQIGFNALLDGTLRIAFEHRNPAGANGDSIVRVIKNGVQEGVDFTEATSVFVAATIDVTVVLGDAIVIQQRAEFGTGGTQWRNVNVESGIKIFAAG